MLFPPGSEFLVIKYSSKKWIFGYNTIDLIHLVPGTTQYNAASTKALISASSILGKFGLYPPKVKGMTALTGTSLIAPESLDTMEAPIPDKVDEAE